MAPTLRWEQGYCPQAAGHIIILDKGKKSRTFSKISPNLRASLDGTLFEITNKNINAVYVNGALYQPGEVCATIEVVDGVAQTDTRALP